jgi:hypothetical protein
MIATVTAATSFTLLCAPLARAADCRVPDLAIDDRVRVASTDLGRWRRSGRVAAADGDGFLFAPEGVLPPRRVTWCSIERLEVARGTKPNSGLGAKVGIVFPGIPLATLITFFFVGGNPDCESSCPGSAIMVLAAGKGLVVGSMIGAVVVGSFDTTTRWVPLRTKKVEVKIRPSHDGIGAAVALRF